MRVLTSSILCPCLSCLRLSIFFCNCWFFQSLVILSSCNLSLGHSQDCPWTLHKVALVSTGAKLILSTVSWLPISCSMVMRCQFCACMHQWLVSCIGSIVLYSVWGSHRGQLDHFFLRKKLCWMLLSLPWGSDKVSRHSVTFPQYFELSFLHSFFSLHRTHYLVS